MKNFVLAVMLLAGAVFTKKAEASVVYTSSATVKNLWIEDYKGFKFCYFTLDKSTYFGFYLNSDNAEFWLSQLELAMSTNPKTVVVGYENTDPVVTTQTKANVKPFFHLGIAIDGGF